MWRKKHKNQSEERTDQAEPEAVFDTIDGAVLTEFAGWHPRRGKTKFTQAQIIKAIKGSAGIKSVIGQKLGCGRGTVAHYIEQYPKVKEAWLEEHEVLGDLAESKLLQKIKGGNTASIVFALTRLFPERGYGDVVRIEQEQSEKPPLALKSLSPETRAALLRDLSGQKQDEDENEAN